MKLRLILEHRTARLPNMKSTYVTISHHWRLTLLEAADVRAETSGSSMEKYTTSLRNLTFKGHGQFMQFKPFMNGWLT